MSEHCIAWRTTDDTDRERWSKVHRYPGGLYLTTECGIDLETTRGAFVTGDMTDGRPECRRCFPAPVAGTGGTEE